MPGTPRICNQASIGRCFQAGLHEHDFFCLPDNLSQKDKHGMSDGVHGRVHEVIQNHLTLINHHQVILFCEGGAAERIRAYGTTNIRHNPLGSAR